MWFSFVEVRIIFMKLILHQNFQIYGTPHYTHAHTHTHTHTHTLSLSEDDDLSLSVNGNLTEYEKRKFYSAM